jgi:hypothetical protein
LKWVRAVKTRWSWTNTAVRREKSKPMKTIKIKKKATKKVTKRKMSMSWRKKTATIRMFAWKKKRTFSKQATWNDRYERI